MLPKLKNLRSLQYCMLATRGKIVCLLRYSLFTHFCHLFILCLFSTSKLPYKPQFSNFMDVFVWTLPCVIVSKLMQNHFANFVRSTALPGLAKSAVAP